jgi:hypothetical protein
LQTSGGTLAGVNIFTNIERSYDAYDKDIAVLNVFFETQTIMEFTTQSAQVIFLDLAR